MNIVDKFVNYLKLIRVKHYIKNFLIFLPLVFSGNLFYFNKFLSCFIGFLIYSFLCSIVYVINDIKDVESDRNHPTKKNRPIAANKVTIKEAVILIGVLFLFILLLLFLLNNINLSIYLFVYLILNIGYSFGLKNIAILDIVILTMGFLIRVLFGASIIDVEVSNWLYLTVIAISFYLSLGKRRNEISNSKNIKKINSRKVLQYYNKDFLDKNMYMFLGIGIVFYSLWSISVNTSISNYLIWTVPMIMIIVMRYSMIIESDSDGDPVEVVMHDKILLLCILLYAILLICFIYFI